MLWTDGYASSDLPFGCSDGQYEKARFWPQSKKWSDQQITLNPTGSIHKKAWKKKFDRKKMILIRGFAFEKNGPCSRENEVKISKKRKMAQNDFSRSDLGS